MSAANTFVESLREQNLFTETARIKAEMFGSLGATGRGHGTPKALILGFLGEQPHSVDVQSATKLVEQAKTNGSLRLGGEQDIAFDYKNDIILHLRESLPFHSNGMKFTAFDEQGNELVAKYYYSVGGGFIVDETSTDQPIISDDRKLKYHFTTGQQLLELANEHQLKFSGIMLKNEKAWRSKAETKASLEQIWQVMQECVQNGLCNTGILPGGLKVPRRAHKLHQQLLAAPEKSISDPLSVLDWVTLYALAVNEENAAGGRVVTAPTNGAAGIIPAVLHYYNRFVPGSNENGIFKFLLTAAAIGILYKENASISGAEVGCQGEVGSACSMAAGALCEVLGGTPEQVENAAEIAMEHNLGLTCDPIGGLVQIPCIERNAMASVKAIHAARMALRGDGTHYVSLDKVIRTMRDTGRDMHTKYKETARGGLAVDIVEVPVNIVEC